MSTAAELTPWWQIDGRRADALVAGRPRQLLPRRRPPAVHQNRRRVSAQSLVRSVNASAVENCCTVKISVYPRTLRGEFSPF